MGDQSIDHPETIVRQDPLRLLFEAELVGTAPLESQETDMQESQNLLESQET